MSPKTYFTRRICCDNGRQILCGKRSIVPFDSKIKTSMEVIPKESSISSVKIGSPDDGKNVYSVNRMVKCDFYKKYVVKDFQTKGKCNHNHKDGYSCNYFKIYRNYLRSNDYYLLIDKDSADNLKWCMDNTRIKLPVVESVTSNKIYLNNRITGITRPPLFSKFNS